MLHNFYNKLIAGDLTSEHEYLHNRLCLSQRDKIVNLEVKETIKTNTANLIFLDVEILKPENETVHEKLLLKHFKANDSNRNYLNHCIREIEFYNLERKTLSLPVATCYDTYVSEDKSMTCLLLKDLSADYSSELRSKCLCYWLSAAKCLAELHGKFWNKRYTADELVEEQVSKKVQEHRNNLDSAFKKFEKYVKNHLDHRFLSIYSDVLTISNDLMRERLSRLSEEENITLIHGDSHIHNFLFNKINHNALLTDFQFWNEGIGVADLAHLTRVSFPNEFGAKEHKLIVETYHDSLLEQGVSGYTFEQCWKDYQKHVACMLLIPMWQYTIFGLEFEKWGKDVKTLIKHYMDVLV